MMRKMREMTFRGKRIDSGEWAYGCLVEWKCWVNNDWIQHSAILNGDLCNRKPLSSDFVEVDPETVGQNAGLHDKNGQEIYEGDIIPYPLIGNLSIAFHCGAFCIKGKGATPNYTSLMISVLEADIEVIGNIWEHPDLLK